jgi:hypothetical protein
VGRAAVLRRQHHRRLPGVDEVPWREDAPLPVVAGHQIPVFKKSAELFATLTGDSAGFDAVSLRIGTIWGLAVLRASPPAQRGGLGRGPRSHPAPAATYASEIGSAAFGQGDLMGTVGPAGLAADEIVRRLGTLEFDDLTEGERAPGARCAAAAVLSPRGGRCQAAALNGHRALRFARCMLEKPPCLGANAQRSGGQPQGSSTRANSVGVDGCGCSSVCSNPSRSSMR